MNNITTLYFGGTAPASWPVPISPTEFVIISVDDLDQSWFWTDEWQEKIAEADVALENGEYKDFDSIDDMIAFLHSDEE